MAKNKNIEPHNRLVVFQGKEIRRAWRDNEWYYSLVDVVGILTDSANPTDYLKKIRKRDVELGSYIGTNCPQVEMEKQYGGRNSRFARLPPLMPMLVANG